MYVLLTQDVPDLGQKNSLANVKSGYFRNYLMPKGLAQQATTEMIDRMRNTIVAKREAVKMASSDASAHARALSGAVIHLSGKASEKGTLFKALLEQDVVDAIMEEYSIEVEPEQIVMAHIKKIGEHAIGVQLDGQVVEIKADVALEGE